MVLIHLQITSDLLRNTGHSMGVKSMQAAKRVFLSEIEALEYVKENLDLDFESAVNLILTCKGRVIVCGMGKSGLVGKKIAASLSSTGTPSFFVHPAEAIHGDLGMIQPGDLFVGLSYSGETSELVNILPYLKSVSVPVIALTSNKTSTLGQFSDIFLNITVPSEACPLQLAPTSSSTAALVMGDALTIALMSARNFTKEHFARFHPGGVLGRKLLSSIRQEMVTRNLPIVSPCDDFMYVLDVITEGELGLAVVQQEGRVVGVVTDGDLRRAVKKEGISGVGSLTAEAMMGGAAVVVDVNASMVDALSLMEKKSISRLVVLDGSVLVGILKK